MSDVAVPQAMGGDLQPGALELKECCSLRRSRCLWGRMRCSCGADVGVSQSQAQQVSLGNGAARLGKWGQAEGMGGGHDRGDGPLGVRLGRSIGGEMFKMPDGDIA